MGFVSKAFAFIKANPGQWATETTTMVGLALIALSFWEVFAGALTVEQATGLVTVGSGLLYPQSPAKQRTTELVVSSALAGIENQRKTTVDLPQGQESVS